VSVFASMSNGRGWPPEVVDRACGAYLGFALGDALGATVEFMTAREIALRFGRHDQIVGGGWLKLPRGAVTDDTTMSLALGQAILDRGGWDMEAIARSWVAWLRGRPVDCGNTCRRGIRRYISDGSLSGPPNEGDGGNGALMRNLPVALATLGDEGRAAAWSLEQAHFTHHHVLSDAATVGFARIVQALILGEASPVIEALANGLVGEHPQFRFRPYPGRASGYVVETAQTVLHHFLGFPDFEACLIETVARGEDADTTGALAGMLAGARCGAMALPPRWVKALDPNVRIRVLNQTKSLLQIAWDAVNAPG
jgi:ADP-ribosyl-[dinitrogen reductase] hydrolase